MRAYVFALAISVALVVGMPARAQEEDHHDGVPKLDQVFVIVLENHNSFTSFGSNGIIGNPQAPNITALWNKYNVATNYNAVWHPSLPNYLAMIDWRAYLQNSRRLHHVGRMAGRSWRRFGSYGKIRP